MRSLAYLLLLISSPVFAASKTDPSSAPDGKALRGSVLVWHDATLYTAPVDSASTLQLATFEGARKDHVGHVVAMKVVASKGAFVEIELAGAEDCTWSRVVVPDDLARVRLFVKRADIAPVVIKPFTKTFADGTAINVGVGTPVIATDAGTYMVSLRGDELEVDVPATSVGHAYAAAKATRTVIAGETLALAAATKATLGDRTLTLSARQAAPGERRGEQTIVAVDDRCVMARVMVASTTLGEVDDTTIDVGTGSGGNDVMSLRDECYLPKLTPLSVGTRMVAVAAKPIYLHAEPMGKNACIQRAIKIESALAINLTDDRLRVCAPATKVMRDRMRSARSAPR
ncbi:MAG TPA: hypothetical protein VIV11_30950 [Kofleriaceae bacterium]